jgi:hypothetical protein
VKQTIEDHDPRRSEDEQRYWRSFGEYPSASLAAAARELGRWADAMGLAIMLRQRDEDARRVMSSNAFSVADDQQPRKPLKRKAKR